MKKIVLSSLVSLFVLSCSISSLNNSSIVKENFAELSIKYHFTELEKEYKSFSTKALSDAYVLRMFNKFLITSPNTLQIIRQLEFARYLKNEKSDSAYFNSLKAIIENDNSIYTKISNSSGVAEKRSTEPVTFGAFVDSLNPNPDSIVTSGLILNLDAGNPASYPGSGTTWLDLSGNGKNATLYYGPVFNSTYGGGIVFDGSNDSAVYNIPYPKSMTVTTVGKSNNSVWNSYAGLGSARRQNGYIIHNQSGSTQVGFHFVNSSATHYGVGSCTPSNIQQPNFYTISTNGSNIHKIYLNGELISTDTTNISRTSSPTSQPGILGRDDFESRYNKVTIYYHSIYNRQLEDWEVLQNYKVLKTRFGL